MLNLSNVDLICVDGRDDNEDLNLSLKALRFSQKNIKFNNVLFISPKKLDCEFQYIEIPKLSTIQEYSKFIIKELKNYIFSDFCILVQHDGFITRPELWDDSFLNYDYVGAPWPEHWKQIDGRKYRVGNGGFSLRSRKLMDIVSYMDFNSSKEQIEDNFICLDQREILESLGINFAPVEIAAKFSWENPISENNPDNTFGFHGRHSLVEKYKKIL